MSLATGGVEWKKARCKGTPDPEIFFAHEWDGEEPLTQVALTYATDKAKAICAFCPIRVECLNWAMAQGTNLVGVWGGLTAQERRSINRPRKKARCIDCGSTSLEQDDRHETCLSCGLSWPI